MDLERSPLALPFPAIPPIAGVTLRVARARLQGLGPLRPDLCRAGRGHGGRGRVHHERVLLERSRAGARAGAARAGAGAGGQRRQFQRLHRLSRARGGRADHGAGRRAPRLRAERGVRLLDRRDRRAAAQGQGARRASPRRSTRRAVLVGGSGRNHRHHRHFRQGRDRHRDGRRHARSTLAGIIKGSRHDRARHGDDARLHLHRRGGRAGLPAAAACRPANDEHLHLHHGRQRHLDQRHRARLRHRQGGQRAARLVRRCRAPTPSPPRCTTSAASSRSSSCATAKARRSSSRSRDRRGSATTARAGSASRSPTRRWSRPRSPARTPTGAAWSWRSARPASRPTATSCRSASAAPGRRARACRWPTTTRRRSPRTSRAARSTIEVDLGLGEGRATVWTCDLTHGYIAINADYRS